MDGGSSSGDKDDERGNSTASDTSGNGRVNASAAVATEGNGKLNNASDC